MLQRHGFCNNVCGKFLWSSGYGKLLAHLTPNLIMNALMLEAAYRAELRNFIYKLEYSLSGFELANARVLGFEFSKNIILSVG